MQGRAARMCGVALVVATSCAHGEDHGAGWVRSLDFEANHALGSGRIRKKLATARTGWWPLAGKRWYDAAALDLDLQRIPALYADHGYFDARVVDHHVERTR